MQAALVDLQRALAVWNKGIESARLETPCTMAKIASDLEKGGEGRVPDPDLVLKTVRRFAETGSLSRYKDVKNVCFGTLVPLSRERGSLVSTPGRLGELIDIVDSFADAPRKLVRCFHGLMGTYFELDGYDASSTHHAQWLRLRHALATWVDKLAVIRPAPEWLKWASAHKSLFSSRPTEHYGEKLLREERQSVEAILSGLDIGPTSWVRRRIVMSAVESAAAKSDAEFSSHLKGLIRAVAENPGISEEGGTALLNRYARQAGPVEHPELRQLATELFGNPLNSANGMRWAKASAQAKAMVSNWLKGFLIERFFELLSQDGVSDRRRPKFWKRYRGSIENMWFVLGGAALNSRRVDYVKLREAMGSHCLGLQNASHTNNAFLMKIGRIVVVEFGETGNATFIFGWDSKPFDLEPDGLLTLSSLKSAKHLERLTHTARDWEEKFAEALRTYGVFPDGAIQQPQRPAAPPAAAPAPPAITGGVFTPPDFRNRLSRFCSERGIRLDDRAPSGRIEVYVDSSNATISGTLGQWGFLYDPLRRRWVKPA